MKKLHRNLICTERGESVCERRAGTGKCHASLEAAEVSGGLFLSPWEMCHKDKQPGRRR